MFYNLLFIVLSSLLQAEKETQTPEEAAEHASEIEKEVLPTSTQMETGPVIQVQLVFTKCKSHVLYRYLTQIYVSSRLQLRKKGGGKCANFKYTSPRNLQGF